MSAPVNWRQSGAMRHEFAAECPGFRPDWLANNRSLGLRSVQLHLLAGCRRADAATGVRGGLPKQVSNPKRSNDRDLSCAYCQHSLREFHYHHLLVVEDAPSLLSENARNSCTAALAGVLVSMCLIRAKINVSLTCQGNFYMLSRLIPEMPESFALLSPRVRPAMNLRRNRTRLKPWFQRTSNGARNARTSALACSVQATMKLCPAPS